MTYLAIMKWTDGNRVAKYREFPTQAEAMAHVSENPVSFPGAFAAPHPGGSFADWLVDPVAGTLSVVPIPPVKPSVLTYEKFQGRFTEAEYDSATVYVFEADTATGKPKRPKLIQAFNRAVAKNAVDLLDAKTAAFMDALAGGSVVTAQRKTEILTP